MIEFDVALTKDGYPVIMHDDTVNRTTDGPYTGKVSSLTLAQIKQLDAGSWKNPIYAGERVPTLQEALAVMPMNAWLNIHLKSAASAGLVAQELVVQGRTHQALIATTHAGADAAKAVYSDVMICNMENRSPNSLYVADTIARGAEFLQLQSLATSSEMATLEAAGVKSNLYDPAIVTASALASFYAAGIDFPLVDNLGTMIQAAQALGVQPLNPIMAPEPGTLALLATGLIVLLGYAWRKRK